MIRKIYQAGVIFGIMGFLLIPCYGLSNQEPALSVSEYGQMEKRGETQKQSAVERKAKEIEEVARDIKKRISQIKASKEKEKEPFLVIEGRKEAAIEFLGLFDYSLELEQRYDDNIYSTGVDKKDDFIRVIRPRISYGTDDTEASRWLKLSSGAEGLFYDRAGKEDAVNFDLATSFNQLIGKRYNLGLRYSLDKSQSTRTEVLEKVVVGSLTDRWAHTYGVNFSADWHRIPWEVDYRREERDYEKELEGSDVDTDRINLTGYFKFWPKTDLLFSYTHRIVDYPNRVGSDYTANVYSLGVRGQITPKISGVAKFGFGSYNYRDRKKDMEDISLALDYNFSRQLRFNLKGRRRVEATTAVEDDSKEVASFSLGWRYQPPFNRRLALGGSIGYTEEEFSVSDRKNETYDLSLTADYLFREWLTFRGSYTFRERISSWERDEYKRNRVSLGLRMDF